MLSKYDASSAESSSGVFPLAHWWLMTVAELCRDMTAVNNIHAGDRFGNDVMTSLYSCCNLGIEQTVMHIVRRARQRRRLWRGADFAIQSGFVASCARVHPATRHSSACRSSFPCSAQCCHPPRNPGLYISRCSIGALRRLTLNLVSSKSIVHTGCAFESC